MVERIPDLPENVLGFTAKGTVTGNDYDSVVVPAAEAMFGRQDKVRFLYHLSEDFSGFETVAVWDDAKLGLKHLSGWERVAVVSDVEWVRWAVRAFGLGIPGQVRVLHNRELAESGRCVPPLAVHVVERLWSLGRHFHAEGSAALRDWVEEFKELVYAGQAEELFDRLYRLRQHTARHGPGTKGRRAAADEMLTCLAPRWDMMRYDQWLAQDLVIATGQVEGAVRHLVGERFDCAGMRWLQAKAEALLHLRCIELNGDWRKFVAWTQRRTHARLRKRRCIKIATDQPLTLDTAA